MMLHFFKILISIIILTTFFGCSEKTIVQDNNNEKTKEEVEQGIIDLYFNWANATRIHDITKINALVVPGANFAFRNDVCQDSWNGGNEYYYSFSAVKVQYSTKSPAEAAVYGNWELHQGIGTEVLSGGFYSSAKPIDGDYWGDNWRLEGMNSNLKENWWQ